MELAVISKISLYFFLKSVWINYANFYLCNTLNDGDVAQLVEHRTENP